MWMSEARSKHVLMYTMRGESVSKDHTPARDLLMSHDLNVGVIYAKLLRTILPTQQVYAFTHAPRLSDVEIRPCFWPFRANEISFVRSHNCFSSMLFYRFALNEYTGGHIGLSPTHFQQ